MKFEYDPEVDAGYLYLVYPINDGGVKKTIPLSDDIILDFDENGKLLGIEVLWVKEKNPSLLEKLKKITISA